MFKKTVAEKLNSIGSVTEKKQNTLASSQTKQTYVTRDIYIELKTIFKT